jgi:hypothetical protein
MVKLASLQRMIQTPNSSGMPLDKLQLNLEQTRGQVTHLTQQLAAKEQQYKQTQAYTAQRPIHSTIPQPHSTGPLSHNTMPPSADPHPKRPKPSSQQKEASIQKLKQELAAGTTAVKRALEQTRTAQQQQEEGTARGEQPTPSHEDPKVLDSYKRRLQFETRQRWVVGVSNGWGVIDLVVVGRTLKAYSLEMAALKSGHEAPFTNLEDVVDKSVQ